MSSYTTQYNDQQIFVKIPLSESNRYTNSINNNGQIAFIDDTNNFARSGRVSYIYAQEQSFGDGALSEKTVLTSNIMVDGGPLANTEVIKKLKKKYTNNIDDYGVVSVSAGTNIQQLLSYLFTATKYPTHNETNKSRNPSFSIAAPSITVKNGNTTVTANMLIEYKTVLTLSTINPAAQYNFNGTTREVTNMIYGFTYGGNNGKNTPGSGTSYSLSWRNATGSSDKISYSIHIISKNGCFSNLSVSNGSITTTSLNTKIGTNKLEIDTRATNASGNFKAAINAMPNIKLKANDGSQPDEDENDPPKTGFISGVSTVTDYNNYSTKNVIDSSNVSLSFVGVYRCFSNVNSNGKNDSASNTALALTSGSSIEVEFNPEFGSNFAMFGYPASKTLTVQIYNPMLNGGSFEPYNGGSTTEEFKYKDINYKRWVRTGEQYTQKVKFKFTFNTALNT